MQQRKAQKDLKFWGVVGGGGGGGLLIDVTTPFGFVNWLVSRGETNFHLYDRRQWC